MNDIWRASWEDALTDLELTLDEAERLLAGDHLAALPDWTPPALDAPPPPDLHARARALLERQQRVIAATTASLTATRRQHQLTQRMASHGRNQTPVYLDVTA